MVGFDHAVFGGDGAAFNQWQQISLYTFSGDIGTTGFTAAADFVDFIEKDNAILFCGSLYSTGFDFFFIDQFGGFFISLRCFMRLGNS